MLQKWYSFALTPTPQPKNRQFCETK